MSAPLKFAGKPRTRNSWNWIPFAISVTIVIFSVYALANRLGDVDFDRVAAHVLAMPGTQIGWAVLFIAGAYATLTCYDYFAVRNIGASHVPYRIAALASFTSYSIGHNIGFTAVSGGAIRYRIYSQFALGIIDVAKLCFLTGLTFWLGNLAVLGTGIAWRPEVASRITELPPGKCLAMAALSPSSLRIQSRAEVALVNVSSVPKVLDETMKRVSSAERSRVDSTKSVESTLDTNRKVSSRIE